MNVIEPEDLRDLFNGTDGPLSVPFDLFNILIELYAGIFRSQSDKLFLPALFLMSL